MTGMGMQSFITDVLPFAAMVMVECTDIGMITLAKAAMNSGMSKFVYVVYYNALGTLILLPYIIFQSCRSSRPTLTFSILCRFFILGFVGICLLQVCAYIGIDYSSPTLAAAIGNLIPVFTFLFAIICRMEKLDLRRSSSQAKSLGTIVAISGAFVMTLYEGPPIQMLTSQTNLPQQLLMLRQSNWALGGLFLAITCICSSIWNVFQTATVKLYPDEMTIVFFCSCFGSIQCAIFTLIIERDLGAWVLQPGIQMTATGYAAIFGSIFRYSIVTWCLGKKGPIYVAMFKPLSTVIAVIMGVMFLGETLHLGSVIGSILIAIGFYTVIWGQAKDQNMVMDIVCGSESSTPNTPLLQGH